MKKHSMAQNISFYVDKSVGYACIIFGMVMTVSTLIGIVFRYIMVNPLPWTEELARYTMIWMGLLAVSMGVKRDTHLGINFFVALLPEIIQKSIKMITRILIGIFLYVLMVYGMSMALNGAAQTMPALRLPMSYVLIAVPLSAFLSLVQLLLIIIIDFTGKGE